METPAGPLELADPLPVVVDVDSAPGRDAAEAAAVVRWFVLSGSLTARLRDWLLATSTTGAVPGRGGLA